MISKEDKKFIIFNCNNMSIHSLFEHFDSKYTKVQLKNFCTNNKLEYKKEDSEVRSELCKAPKSQRNQTKINHDYFKVWSSDMAYVFGLWCADGFISKSNNTYQFSIKLHKDDKNLLQSVLNSMESGHKIYDDKDNSCFFNIGSKTIVTDIMSLGGKEAKSLDLPFPYVPQEYLDDFVRGYFDGDGCVSYSKFKKALFASISGGSVEFLTKLLDMLKIFSNVEGGCVSKNQRSVLSNTYKISLGRKDSKSLAEFIYRKNSNLKLIRKYNLYQKNITQ